MMASEELQLGRAKNAVMFYLERNLIVPKIYVDADWGGQRVDILAIDRDGVGDVHAVLLFPRLYFPDGDLDIVREGQMVKMALDRFQDIPAQFKYVAAVETHNSRRFVPFDVADSLLDRSFSSDGMGRVAFVTVDVTADGDPKVSSNIKPERFRAKIAKLADEYVQQHEADWEIRA